MSHVITDHDDVPERQGQWRTGRCDRCGEPTRDHSSWARRIAERVGGRPEDYMDVGQ